MIRKHDNKKKILRIIDNVTVLTKIIIKNDNIKNSLLTLKILTKI